jgi:hypothetical protein
MRRFPTKHGYWVSWRTLPVRGWITQQIRKFAIANYIQEDVLVCCDSDMAFIKPFSLQHLLIQGKLGLLDVDYQDDNVCRWTKTAQGVLGIPGNVAVRGHVGQLICWQRDVIMALQHQIEAANRRSWQETLARLPSFSEYILYGVFVREMLGYPSSGHAPSQIPLVKTSWDWDISTPTRMHEFFLAMEDTTIAVMAHSKDNIDQKLLRRYVETQWAKNP